MDRKRDMTPKTVSFWKKQVMQTKIPVERLLGIPANAQYSATNTVSRNCTNKP